MPRTGPNAVLRVLRALGALATALAAVVLLPAAPALACSCAGPLSDAEAARQADVVVSGELLARRKPPWRLLSSSADLATYVVRVERVHEGSAAALVEVRTAPSGASCGLELPGSGHALLFLREQDGALTAGLCDGSRLAGDAEAVAALGPGRPPTPDGPGAPRDDGPGTTRVAAVTGMVAVAAVLAVAVPAAARRRRLVGGRA